MFNVKKNSMFVSENGEKKIRVTHVYSDGYASVANVDKRNRSVKNSHREIQVDSIRRRYTAAS